MLIKLSEILKQQGLFSQDIKVRIKNKQIQINGESISEDNEIDCVIIKDKRDNDVIDIVDAGDFLFGYVSNENWLAKIKIFGFENLFNTNIENELTLVLKGFMFIKVSKKQMFVLKKANIIS
jgi:hypothetical protein